MAKSQQCHQNHRHTRNIEFQSHPIEEAGSFTSKLLSEDKSQRTPVHLA